MQSIIRLWLDESNWKDPHWKIALVGGGRIVLLHSLRCGKDSGGVIVMTGGTKEKAYELAELEGRRRGIGVVD